MSALRRMLDFFANWSFDPTAASVGDVPTWDGNDFIAQAQQGGGGGLPSWFQSGSGSPVGTVTPSQKGALYQDTTNGALYVNSELPSDDPTGLKWRLIGGVNNGVAVSGVMESRNGNLVLLADGDSTSIFITDVLGWNGPGNGLYWFANSADGQQTLDVFLGAADQHWQWKVDGGLQLPGGNSLYNTAAAPDNAVGADGDWSLGADGHLYFKAAGSWSQKV